jgi:hypothetical protein
VVGPGFGINDDAVWRLAKVQQPAARPRKGAILTVPAAGRSAKEIPTRGHYRLSTGQRGADAFRCDSALAGHGDRRIRCPRDGRIGRSSGESRCHIYGHYRDTLVSPRRCRKTLHPSERADGGRVPDALESDNLPCAPEFAGVGKLCTSLHEPTTAASLMHWNQTIFCLA